jgi:hypothetical protein
MPFSANSRNAVGISNFGISKRGISNFGDSEPVAPIATGFGLPFDVVAEVVSAIAIILD